MRAKDMLATFSAWIARRRLRTRLCAQDARRLLTASPATAYYDAHRIATRARVSGDAAAFMRWVRVGAEIARISDTPMDMKVLRAVVDAEEALAKGDAHPKD